MSRRGRLVVFLPGLAILAGLAVWAVLQLSDFGHPHSRYAKLAVSLTLHQRHATNTVNGITYDLRGFDTLGEELILFSAAIGTSVLLRAQREDEQSEEGGEEADEERPQVSGALRAMGAVLVAPVLVLGVYIVVHGHLSPGGGFQGGIILAGALLLVYAAGQVIALERVEPTSLVEVAEAVGAAAYGMVAVGGLVAAGAAVYNFAPYGMLGSLLSAGTIPILSIVAGLEVTGGVALILTEFLDQTLLRRAGGQE